MGSDGIESFETIGHKKDIKVLGYGNTALAQALAPRRDLGIPTIYLVG